MSRYPSIAGSLIFGTLFFLMGLLTLPDYGINWDTINHLPRGQSYLNYFLTGERDFSNLPEFRWYWQKADTLFFEPVDFPREEVPRVSLYQSTGLDFNYFVDNDGGHPPTSDILSSFFNFILFQKLGLVNDIDSYRVYGIFLAAVLGGVMFWWVGSLYGRFAGLIASLSLALYPLFWSESHFNTEKDIPETVFWGLMLFSLWQGVRKKSVSWTLAAGLIFGLALGTKFNIVFVPFVILPWILFVAAKEGWARLPVGFLKENKAFFLSLILAPALGVTLFFAFWPYLWADPIGRLQNVIGFYKGIGLTQNVDPRFIWSGINTYPAQWIIYTTPPIILILGAVGFLVALKNFVKEKHGAQLLIVLWFLAPVLRVTLPGTTLYGGIRQIMEYIPAMAALAGIGACFLFQKEKLKGLLAAIIIFSFAILAFNLVRIHPNENVYFNKLIGGLSGAKAKDFPFWGNSFGAAYRQGVIWLNENAPEGAKIAYARELIPNIPRIWLSKEASLTNGNRSGYLRGGEYVIALTYEGVVNTSYFDRYLDRYLEPVYEVKVDGVPILKVWKNDKEHTRQGYLNEKQIQDFEILRAEDGLRFDFGKVLSLSRIEADFSQKNCVALNRGYVRISTDGLAWERLPGTMPKEDWSVPKLKNQPTESSVLIPFAADEARYVDIVISPPDACLGKLQNIKVFVFSED